MKTVSLQETPWSCFSLSLFYWFESDIQFLSVHLSLIYLAASYACGHFLYSLLWISKVVLAFESKGWMKNVPWLLFGDFRTDILEIQRRHVVTLAMLTNCQKSDKTEGGEKSQWKMIPSA